MLHYSIVFTEEDYIYIILYEGKTKRKLKMTKDEYIQWMIDNIKIINNN